MNLVALVNSTRPKSLREYTGPWIGPTFVYDLIRFCGFSRRTLPPAAEPGCMIPGSHGSLGRSWVSVLLIAILSGCAARPRPEPFVPSVNIPLECATSIRLTDCDLSVSHRLRPLCWSPALPYSANRLSQGMRAGRGQMKIPSRKMKCVDLAGGLNSTISHC
jgi:hypothetical protein